ncbi:MAG: hypothetical protein AB8G23_07850, partial [Myxococcota bacterium]
MGTGEGQESRGSATGTRPKQAPEQRHEEVTVPDADAAAFDAMDTTSWSGSAPPVLIEEEETIVSVPEPEPEPESESESESEPEA